MMVGCPPASSNHIRSGAIAPIDWRPARVSKQLTCVRSLLSFSCPPDIFTRASRDRPGARPSTPVPCQPRPLASSATASSAIICLGTGHAGHLLQLLSGVGSHGWLSGWPVVLREKQRVGCVRVVGPHICATGCRGSLAQHPLGRLREMLCRLINWPSRSRA